MNRDDALHDALEQFDDFLSRTHEQYHGLVSYSKKTGMYYFLVGDYSKYKHAVDHIKHQIGLTDDGDFHIYCDLIKIRKPDVKRNREKITNLMDQIEAEGHCQLDWTAGSKLEGEHIIYSTVLPRKILDDHDEEKFSQAIESHIAYYHHCQDRFQRAIIKVFDARSKDTVHQKFDILLERSDYHQNLQYVRTLRKYYFAFASCPVKNFVEEEGPNKVTITCHLFRLSTFEEQNPKLISKMIMYLQSHLHGYAELVWKKGGGYVEFVSQIPISILDEENLEEFNTFIHAYSGFFIQTRERLLRKKKELKMEQKSPLINPFMCLKHMVNVDYKDKLIVDEKSKHHGPAAYTRQSTDFGGTAP